MPHAPFLNKAIQAAQAAGEKILRALERPHSIRIEQKGRHDWVSNVDREAEHTIVELLHEAYPHHNFLTEEQGLMEFSHDDYLWIIDPLDGTTNFLHQLPYYAVSIALQYQGRIEHAVIYHPPLQECFVASRGVTAQCNGRRIRISDHITLEGALISMGLPHHEQHLKTFHNTVDYLHHRVAGIRRTGSAALDLAYLAAGRLDLFCHDRLHPWDMAAGLLLVREAGGLVTDLKGGEQCFEKQEIIAANPKLLRQALPLMFPST